MTDRRTLKMSLMCLSVIAITTVALGSAQAGSAPKKLSLRDCYDQTAFFPIPREQAASYLPKGFEPHGSPAGEPSLINFYVTSFLCGDPSEPAFEMVTTYISVIPPTDRAAEGGHEYYIVDTGADGPLAGHLRKKLCLDATLKDAAVGVTPQRVELLGGPRAGAASTSVVSSFLSMDFVVTAQEDSTPRINLVRWFFGAEGRSFYDVLYRMSGWGIGSSASVFTQPYKGLTNASPGFGVLSTTDVMFMPARGCSA